MSTYQAQARRGRAAYSALVLVALCTATVSLSGCAALKKAPGINMLFGEDGPVLPGDPTAEAGVDYEIAVQGLGVGETEEETAENLRILGIVQENARIYKLKDKPPPSIALLRRRAAADMDIVERALRSEGYYEGDATITVDDAPKSIATEAGEPEASGSGSDPDRDKPVFADIAEPEGTPVVNLYVRKGPRYSLARHQVTFQERLRADIETQVRQAAAGNVGGPAAGRFVVDAEEAALEELNKQGRPYARKGKRRAEANFDHDTLDVITPLAPGPFTVYGDTDISGYEQVERDYIAGFITWKRGDTVSRDEIRDLQRELAATRLFDAVTVEIPSEPPEDHPEGDPFYAPVTVVVEEAKHRTVSAGLSFSTTDGPGGRAKWEHRNLFGRNEQLGATIDVSTVRQGANLTYRKPRFTSPDRNLIGGLEVFHEETDAFDVIGATGGIGIEEEFSDTLRGSLGVAVDLAQTTEDGVDRESYLLGLPATLAYDDTDDLLDPTEGVRASAALTPWGGLFDDEAAGFVVADLNGSTYLALDRKKRYIFATRARAAAIFAEERERVPAQRRLYAGGGGSVRGYETQFVGPFDADDDPTGGLTAAELSAEMRMRFGNFGVVPFVDAGIVSEDLFSQFDDIRYGAGLGLRYFSPVGPIRFDLAVPLNKRSRDDAFQFYLSIGQAF